MFFFSSRRRHTRCALVTGFRRVLFRSPAVTWSGLAEPSTAPARLPPLLVLSGIQKRPRHEAAAFVTLRHYHLAHRNRPDPLQLLAHRRQVFGFGQQAAEPQTAKSMFAAVVDYLRDERE